MNTVNFTTLKSDAHSLFNMTETKTICELNSPSILQSPENLGKWQYAWLCCIAQLRNPQILCLGFKTKYSNRSCRSGSSANVCVCEISFITTEISGPCSSWESGYRCCSSSSFSSKSTPRVSPTPNSWKSLSTSSSAKSSKYSSSSSSSVLPSWPALSSPLNAVGLLCGLLQGLLLPWPGLLTPVGLLLGFKFNSGLRGLSGLPGLLLPLGLLVVGLVPRVNVVDVVCKDLAVVEGGRVGDVNAGLGPN